MELLTLLPIFGYALFIFVYFGLRASSAVFISTSFMVTTIVLLAMIGLLKEASYAVFAIGVILFLYIPYKYRDKNIEFFSSTPTVLLIIFSLVFFFISRDSHFFFWDEFSHWGLFIKEMMYTDRLYDASTLAAHPHYVPGAPTWQYFTMLFSGFNEGGAYFAQFLLIASATMMIYEKTSFKKPHWIVLAFLLQIAFLANFGHGLNKIYVDHVVGAMFAGLIMVILYDRFDKKSIFLLLAPLTAIAFIKEVGLYFSAASVGLLLLRYIFIEKNKKLIYISILLGVLALVVFKSWDVRLNVENIPKSATSMSYIVKSLLTGEKPISQETEKIIKDRWMEVFLHQQISNSQITQNFNEFNYALMELYTDEYRLSTAGAILLIAILIALMSFTFYRKNPKKVLLYGTYILITTSVFIAIIYLSYFIVFNDAMKKGLVSYMRYTHTALLPTMFFLISLLLPISRDKSEIEAYSEKPISKPEIFPLIVLFAFTVYIYALETPYLKTIYKPNELISIRSYDQNILSALVQNNIPQNEKILAILPPESYGHLRNYLRYDMSPKYTNITTLNLQDVLSSKGALASLSEKIAKNEYLFLPYQDNNLKKIYSEIFSNNGNVFTFYKVTTSKEKQNLELQAIF